MDKMTLELETEDEIKVVYSALIQRKDWATTCKESGASLHRYWNKEIELCEKVLQRIEKIKHG